MDDGFIEIIALHEIEPKFLQDLANAKLYKIIKRRITKISFLLIKIYL